MRETGRASFSHKLVAQRRQDAHQGGGGQEGAGALGLAGVVDDRAGMRGGEVAREIGMGGNVARWSATSCRSSDVSE